MKNNVLIKLFSIFATLTMILSLYSCNKATAQSEQTTQAASVTTEAESESLGQDEIYTDPYEIYEVLTQNGYTGTFEEWVESLKGADGETPYIKNGNWWIGDVDTGVKAIGVDGANGANGKDGITPHIGKNGNWWIGTTDTGVSASGGSSSSVLSSDNIITLNKDMEPYVIQAASGRPESFGDEYKVLQFVHTGDMHTRVDMWNRMVEWINYYQEYISFAVHAGDYVGGTQAAHTNMYAEGDECAVPILNLPGNHDTMLPDVSKQQTASKESVYDIIYGTQCESWGVTFMDCEYPLSYYKDFPESNIRFIGIDLYYDIDAQRVWLASVLEDARVKGMHVITSTHEATNNIEYPLDTPFHSYNYDLYTPLGKQFVEDVIVEFKKNGGVHIANLMGHEHHDVCGYTINGVLNIGVESGTPWEYWCDGVRVEGTKTYDAFNVIAVDTNAGVIKVIRIGNNTDPYMRTKDPLCYDYINKKMIAGGTVAEGGGSAGAPEDDYVVPEYVNAYLDPVYLASRPAGGNYQINPEGLIEEDGVLFTRVAGQDKVGQIFWTRIGFDGSGTPWPSAQINPIEVGTAKYLVVKMKGSINVSSLNFKLGTITGEATPDNISSMKLADINLPQDKITESDWTYFVFDLENTWKDYWAADENGNHTVCYLQFTMNGNFASDMYLDLASMAFLDDWSEVSLFIDAAEAELVYASNASVTVDAISGACKGSHAIVESVSGRTYSYLCAACGAVVYHTTVSESINWYSGLASMGVYQNKLEYNLYDEENNVVFNRYSGAAKPDHLNITGGPNSGSATAATYDTGKYLVIKYRATTDGSIGLYASTDSSKTGALRGEDDRGSNQVGSQSSSTVPGNTWVVAVIDLSHVGNYSCDTTNPIYIMLNPNQSNYTFDIAYAAVVDDVDEARKLISDETFALYTNGWTNYTIESVEK